MGGESGDPPQPPVEMSMLEGLGCLLVLGGGLTLTGIIPNPQLLVPLAPLGVLGLVLGSIVLYLARRVPR